MRWESPEHPGVVLEPDDVWECEYCDGSGLVDVQTGREGRGRIMEAIDCAACHGSGWMCGWRSSARLVADDE